MLLQNLKGSSMEERDDILLINRVFFSYEKTAILEDISLSIKEGDFVGIFGPNGGGKTTLLRLIMGLIKPLRGSVLLWGVPPHKNQTKIGYVPQVARFDKQFPITVEEVVQMGALSRLSNWGRVSSSDKECCLQALEKVGMLAHKKQVFGTLSGGQAQRVLIARALACNPKMLILDEPTASVDPKAEKEILDVLLSLKGSITLLMVTHDLQTIVEHVEKLFCVHRNVHAYSSSDLCEHFGLGLYHTPLIKTGFSSK